jgi:phosphohistidine phosphatase
MKTLFLIRHAKSSWDELALVDQQRPLSDRGRRDAPKMGKRLAKRNARPDLMLSSPALRALKTARMIAKKLGRKRKHIAVDSRLYAAEVADLLRLLRRLDNRLKRVMLFGHNPELSGLARHFADEVNHLPTCAVAKFKFDVNSWRRIGRATLIGVALDFPKRSPANATLRKPHGRPSAA